VGVSVFLVCFVVDLDDQSTAAMASISTR